MGGLVVKQALVTAKNNDGYKNIRAATTGLCFFAVPHQGGHGASLGIIAKNIVVSLTGDSKNNLVESLQRNSLFQESQAELFKHQLEDYRIVSIIEDRPIMFTKFLGRATSLVCFISLHTSHRIFAVNRDRSLLIQNLQHLVSRMSGRRFLP